MKHLISALALGVLVVCGVAAQAAKAHLSEGTILFSDGTSIHWINPNGTGRTRLSEGSQPDASPRGSKIAFVSGFDIFVMNADGSGRQNITNTPDYAEQAPDWSPDGTKIAFMAAPNTALSGPFGGYSIFVVNASGSGRKRLTSPLIFGDGGHIADWAPKWSPNGMKIAFTRAVRRLDGSYNQDIFVVSTVMNADGGYSQSPRTTNSAPDLDPAWSPDGSKIAWSRDGYIYAMNADGSNQVKVSRGGWASRRGPAWSPDGTKIAFFLLNQQEIRVMNADGSGERFLTNGNGPDWRPFMFTPCDYVGCPVLPPKAG